MNKKPIVYAFIDSQNLNLGIKAVVRVDRLKASLEYKKDQRRRSVETLGVSGHGDNNSIAKKKSPRKDKTLKGKSSIGDRNIVARKPIRINKSKGRQE